MYGSGSNILKQEGNIILRQSIQHKHGFLKSGRGTIKTEIRYHVEYSDSHLTENYSGVFNMRTKAEALRTFKQVVKYGMGSLVQEVV